MRLRPAFSCRYTKLQNRLLRPLLNADKPPARIGIRHAPKTLEAAVNDYIANARLAPAIQELVTTLTTSGRHVELAERAPGSGHGELLNASPSSQADARRRTTAVTDG